MHEVHAVAEPRQPLPRDGEGVGVAVEADQHQLGKAIEEGFGVTRHTERGVDQYRSRAHERGGEQLDGAVEHDGDMDLRIGHNGRGFVVPFA